MDAETKQTLCKQFGASIDMLENAITFCNDRMIGCGRKPDFGRALI